MIPYETHKWSPDIKIIHFEPSEEVDGNAIIVSQLRNHSAEHETVPRCFLSGPSSRQRRAGIIAQMAAAAGPWSSADKSGSEPRLKGCWRLPVCLRLCRCPAAVSAGWWKGILVPRPLLISAVINSSIFLPETWAPSLIFPVTQKQSRRLSANSCTGFQLRGTLFFVCKEFGLHL